MSESAQALAEQFEQANNEAIVAIEGCSDEQWRRHVASENRSVGVVMHHVVIKESLFNHEIDPYTGQNGSGLQQSEAFPELHKTEFLLVRARMSTLVGEIQKKLSGRRSMDLPGEEDDYLHCSDEGLMGLGEKLETSIRSQYFRSYSS